MARIPRALLWLQLFVEFGAAALFYWTYILYSPPSYLNLLVVAALLRWAFIDARKLDARD